MTLFVSDMNLMNPEKKKQGAWTQDALTKDVSNVREGLL